MKMNVKETATVDASLMSNVGAVNLANAIVERLVDDYEIAYEKWRRFGNEANAREMALLRKQSASGWFDLLTTLSVPGILDRIEERVDAKLAKAM